MIEKCCVDLKREDIMREREKKKYIYIYIYIYTECMYVCMCKNICFDMLIDDY